jgi:hypothetical protein
LDDIDEPLHAANSFGWYAREVMILRLHPLPGFFVVTADERVETSIKSQEQERQLTFFRVRIEAASGLKPRDRRLARADHSGEVAVTQTEPGRR